MLIEVPPQPRRGRGYVRKRKKAPAPPPPQPLSLVSASYDSDNFWLFLTFDRAIAVDPVLAGDQLTLDDGQTWHQFFDGGGGWEIAGATIKISLNGDEVSESSGVHLTASNATQIIAVDDGGTWEGCTNLVVPFP